jgi:hypothetical protein
MSQGSRANDAGQDLEDQVEDFLKEFNVEGINYLKWIRGQERASNGAAGLLLKNVPYITFHGSNGRGEFLLTVDGKKDVRIECRKQSVAGSADEKLACLFENAKAFEERIVILVVEGEGFKPSLVEWLDQSCKSVKHKQILKVTFEEFKDWARNFLTNNK